MDNPAHIQTYTASCCAEFAEETMGEIYMVWTLPFQPLGTKATANAQVAVSKACDCIGMAPERTCAILSAPNVAGHGNAYNESMIATAIKEIDDLLSDPN